MAAFEVADWTANAGQLYRGFASRNILRSELQELSPGLRVVFMLRDVEGSQSRGRKFLSGLMSQPKRYCGGLAFRCANA
jgi:hypothetical protein